MAGLIRHSHGQILALTHGQIRVRTRAQTHAQSHAQSRVLTDVLIALASVELNLMWHLALASALRNLVHRTAALVSAVLSRETLGKYLAFACLPRVPGGEAQAANTLCLVVCFRSWSHCQDHSLPAAVRLKELPWQRSWWRLSKKGSRASR